MDEALFPRTVERDASPEEYNTQRELACWTFDALHAELRLVHLHNRKRNSELTAQKNGVKGIISVLADQSAGRELITPDLERRRTSWQEF
ncbi:MAG TPA: hypothetical protein VFM68_04290 [Candidatus Saccharimonadales bacterium]|nr:hypothetical protein [Candidatus Saccharimonadales bacterium]